MAVIGSRKAVLRLATPLVSGTFTDFTAEVSDVRIVAAQTDSDFQSFIDAANGGARMYTLKLKMRQDNATSSLWSYAWTLAGQDCPVEFWPSGRPVSGTATSAQPKIVGTVTLAEPDGDFIGGEANASNQQVWTTEVEWRFTAKPVMTP